MLPKQIEPIHKLQMMGGAVCQSVSKQLFRESQKVIESKTHTAYFQRSHCLHLLLMWKHTQAQTNRWRLMMNLFLTRISFFFFLFSSDCFLVCPHYLCVYFPWGCHCTLQGISEGISIKLHVQPQKFSHIDIHCQANKHGHTNTLQLTNRGHVMTHAQMFPGGSVADLLSWLSAACHKDGWRC